MLLLEDLQDPNGPLARITAVCPTSSQFLSYVNQATRRLLRRGDWPETTVGMFICVKQGCIVWPRQVQEVRKLNICNRHVDVRNLWFRYMDLPHGCSQWSTTDWPDGLMGWLGQPLPGLFDEGRTSVMQDVMGDGRLIRAYPRCQADIGQTLTIFGTDNNGQPLQERDSSDDSWSDGVTITLTLPFGSTSTYVRHIDYVVKDQTECPVNVFAYNAAQNVLEDIAQYDGNETRPSYQRTKLTIPFAHTPWTGQAGSTPSCCASLRGVMALVKLRHIPAQNPLDLIIPDNEDAIEDMVQSIKFKEKGDMSNAMAYEASAIRELQRDQENNSPDYEFSANDLTVGANGFSQSQF